MISMKRISILETYFLTNLMIILKADMNISCIIMFLHSITAELKNWISLSKEAISSSYFKFVSFSVNVIICTPPDRPSRLTVQTVPLLRMVHSFSLKFSAKSNDYQICLWTKLQVEVLTFDFSINILSLAENPIESS
jgi:hypothetical protein